MGNKQKELEVTVLVQSFALIPITEIWWDKYHDYGWLQAGQKGQEPIKGQQGSPLHWETNILWRVVSRKAMSKLKA